MRIESFNKVKGVETQD